MGTTPAVEMKGVTKVYGSFRALDGLSLAVEEGVIFGLLGPNGAGKTTTIKILITLLQPTGGEVKVLGYDAVPAREAPCGSVMYRNALDRFLTGRENSTFGELVHLSVFRSSTNDRLSLCGFKRQGDELYQTIREDETKARYRLRHDSQPQAALPG
jgi:ABC-type multidrug transport system ATPase subunit